MPESIRTYQKLLCEYVDAQAVRDRKIKQLEAVNTHLLGALQDLLSDCREYARINNLHNDNGKPATNHAMRRADAAIAQAEAAGIKAEG